MTMVEEIAAIIADRALRAVATERPDLLVMGYRPETLDECLPAAQDAARRICEERCRLLALGAA